MGRLSEHRTKNPQCTETQSGRHNFSPADKWAYQGTGNPIYSRLLDG
jgi:hypothetical protein